MSSNRTVDAPAEGTLGTGLFRALLRGFDRSPHYRLARRFYHRYENLAAGAFFFGGVTWDALTLQRVGALLDNLILGIYLLLLGGFIVLALLDRNDRPLPPSLQALGTWSLGAVQFLAGGLFSAYVIYYTRSASLTTASLFLLVLVLFGGLTTFYVQHWIPPVPLALKHAGVYHDVERDGDAFVLRQERSSRARFWEQKGDDPFHYAPGDTVHCFTAIYAPADLRTRVVHRWQRYDPIREAWLDTDHVKYRVVGGRRSGYRGVTYKQHVQPGTWRVNVETAAGRPIGRIRFEVVAADSSRQPTFTTHRYY